MIKSIFLSRTFWVNAISGFLAILSLPQVQQLPPETLLYISLVTPVLNIILRRLTDSPVEFSTPKNVGRLVLALGLLTMVPMTGCALLSNATPPGLSLEGQKAYHATSVVKGLDVLRDTAIAAHAQKLLSEDTTRAVVKFHLGAIKTIDAFPLGWPKVVDQALSQLTNGLPKKEKELLTPYIALVRILLKEVE